MGLRIIPDGVLRLGSGHGFRVFGGGGAALTYDQRVLALAPIAYWPLNEFVGTTGAGSVLDCSGNDYHATPTGVTFGATGIGDGETAADFDGTTSLVNLPAGFKAAFSGVAGTVVLWLRIAAPEWADGTFRHAFITATGTGDSIQIAKENGVNVVMLYLKAAASEFYFFVPTVGTTDFAQYALSWSLAEDEVKGYFNSAQSGATQTGLGVWSGAIGDALIGTNTAAFHKGQIARVAIFNKALSAAEILSIASP